MKQRMYEKRTGKCIDQQTDIRYIERLEMWANTQCNGRPAEYYRWRPLFNAAKFG